jgi:hypothetical protein
MDQLQDLYSQLAEDPRLAQAITDDRDMLELRTVIATAQRLDDPSLSQAISDACWTLRCHPAMARSATAKLHEQLDCSEAYWGHETENPP